eukprot:TRINITY_DN8091_c0_g1_i5.p1 TRINITY_DN8091_c0_g1~~TRINITY_DN8091_c0_g1_i5.p1  ORF type:complete len:151 (-),score=22.11 TRINITY_DN8091_c0_g1_i5:64-459(-)
MAFKRDPRLLTLTKVLVFTHGFQKQSQIADARQSGRMQVAQLLAASALQRLLQERLCFIQFPHGVQKPVERLCFLQSAHVFQKQSQIVGAPQSVRMQVAQLLAAALQRLLQERLCFIQFICPWLSKEIRDC